MSRGSAKASLARRHIVRARRQAQKFIASVVFRWHGGGQTGLGIRRFDLSAWYARSRRVGYSSSNMRDEFLRLKIRRQCQGEHQGSPENQREFSHFSLSVLRSLGGRLWGAPELRSRTWSFSGSITFGGSSRPLFVFEAASHSCSRTPQQLHSRFQKQLWS